MKYLEHVSGAVALGTTIASKATCLPHSSFSTFN